MGGHAWAGLLMYWYSVPARLTARLLYRAFVFTMAFSGAISSAFDRTGLVRMLLGPMVRLSPYLFLGFLALGLWLTQPALLLLFTIPFLLAWFGRLGELYADRVAADVGYGPALLEVLYGWLEAGYDVSEQQASWRARTLASHPTCATRIRALEGRA